MLSAYNKGIIGSEIFTVSEREYFRQWTRSGKEKLYANEMDYYSYELIECCLIAMDLI